MPEEERWMPIPGFEHLAVSNRGRVLDRYEEQLLSIGVDRGGWCRVLLNPMKKTVGGKPRQARVHNVMAYAFVKGWDRSRTVKHVNGDRSDNHIENLYGVHSQSVVGYTYDQIVLFKWAAKAVDSW